MFGSEGYNLADPVLICGFGDVGQAVANMLESPALARPGSSGAQLALMPSSSSSSSGSASSTALQQQQRDQVPYPYVAFDLTVGRVQAAQEAGFNVLYGDGSRT